MNNENNTINIGVDTVEEIVILTSSLGGTVINNFTSNKD